MAMNLNMIKKILTNVPYSIGKPVSYIPFSIRPGVARSYLSATKDCYVFKSMSQEEKKEFIFNRVRNIACYAFANTKIYKEIYKNVGFDPFTIDSFDDIKRIPILDKSTLQTYGLDSRSAEVNSRALVNTGGSSGQPLEFYIQSSAVGHEWAHMHEAWRNIGFRFSDLKVMFVGRSMVRDIVDYDAGRHSLVVDTYKPWHVIVGPLKKKVFRLRPKFLHGYPSAIFDFLLWVVDNDPDLFSYFRERLVGLILSSEFPSSALRQKVEHLYGLKSLSFYGHTERCVLATEKNEHYRFHPFQTYGFAEAVDFDDGCHLVGTSYYNYASPLVRYDTSDLILPETEDGILSSFSIESGRVGEYVLDRSGQKVFLTALIFGRHHEAFNYVTHVQVFQPRNGLVLVLISHRAGNLGRKIKDLFDFSNVDMDFEFYEGEEPIKTMSGKVPLLVKDMVYENFAKI
uniref:Phenylacetate-CoA ligase n=1 Tax=Marinobacter nauticus TaxID=2743 RepID=A0A455WD44_MARNT|nr:hypothetical protein YBY_24740 [Marinobacter nauticus]